MVNQIMSSFDLLLRYFMYLMVLILHYVALLHVLDGSHTSLQRRHLDPQLPGRFPFVDVQCKVSTTASAVLAEVRARQFIDAPLADLYLEEVHCRGGLTGRRRLESRLLALRGTSISSLSPLLSVHVLVLLFVTRRFLRCFLYISSSVPRIDFFCTCIMYSSCCLLHVNVFHDE